MFKTLSPAKFFIYLLEPERVMNRGNSLQLPLKAYQQQTVV